MSERKDLKMRNVWHRPWSSYFEILSLTAARATSLRMTGECPRFAAQNDEGSDNGGSRSVHVGFTLLTIAIFFARDIALIDFSRAIASTTRS